jgi:tripeptide aminopeptidase
MQNDIYQKEKERMIRYAKVNTQSQPYSGTWPTTSCQFDLARMLRDELVGIGVSDVFLDEKSCVIYGHIHSEIGNKSWNKIGFIAHIDTAPDASGEDVKPWVLERFGAKEAYTLDGDHLGYYQDETF